MGFAILFAVAKFANFAICELEAARLDRRLGRYHSSNTPLKSFLN